MDRKHAIYKNFIKEIVVHITELTIKNTHVFKSVFFCQVTFGLVEAVNRTNGQFAHSNPSLNQTKGWQMNTFFSTFFRKNTCVFQRTHLCSFEHMCVFVC